MSRVSGTGNEMTGEGLRRRDEVRLKNGPCRGHQRRTLLPGKGEGIGEHAHGFQTRGVAGPTLQVTDATPAQPRSLGQLLLGQRRRGPQLP